MKVALYTRVSTLEMSQEGYSLAAQLKRLEAFCVSQNWNVQKVYREEGVSAKNMERPELQKLLKELDQFDVVLVYKLDRLSRSVIDVNLLLEQFEKHNVSFKSATEPYDTSSAQGRMFINIIASLAQFERQQLSERTHMGMTQSAEEGKRNGGRAPFGYKSEEGKLIINEDEAKWVRWIFDTFKLKGKSVIATELNRKGIRSRTGTMWNGSMIDYLVRNPVYYGAMRWNYRKKNGARTYEEIVVPADHEPIISKEEFDEISSMRKTRRQKGHKGHVIYPFSGILKCSRCGKNLIGGKRKRADGSIYRFYKCTGRFTYGICDMPVIAEDTVEDKFIRSIDIADVEIEVPNEEAVNVAEIQSEISRVRGRMERLEELYIEGDIPKKKYREKLEDEKEKETALMQSLSTSENAASPDMIREMVNGIKDNWSALQLEDKKKAVHSIFSSITVECLSTHTGGKGKRADIEFTAMESIF